MSIHPNSLSYSHLSRQKNDLILLPTDALCLYIIKYFL